MSALHQTEHPVDRAPRTFLRLVPRPRTQVGRTPFLLIVAGILAVGMVGLLLLNTHLQNQAFEANRLKRETAALAYQEGELEQALVVASSTTELTRRATALGLRPNRGIAYVNLADGKIAGYPMKEDGLYLPEALELSPEERRANNEKEATNAADHRRDVEQKAVEAARQRLLDARAKAEAEARAKAEADARARGQANPPQANQPPANQPQANQPANAPRTNQPQMNAAGGR
ncbi:hypothetical protein [Mariniluteicoccus flavus]